MAASVSEGGVSFVVDEKAGRSSDSLKVAAPMLVPSGTPESAIESTGVDVSAELAQQTRPVLSSHQNHLIAAVYTAFTGEYPLALSPDHIWLTIVQGLSRHIDQNPEQARASFGITFNEPQEITVVRPEFQRRAASNDWQSVFPEFATKIGAHIGAATAEWLTPRFTTTTPVARIAAEISLMSTTRHFFRFGMKCGCGIPRVRLLGTIADWEDIRRRAERLNDFGLQFWTEELLPVLDHFVAAAKGHPDVSFWKSATAYGGASSYPVPVNGWVAALFPYVHEWPNSPELIRNPCLRGWRGVPWEGCGRSGDCTGNVPFLGLHPGCFPAGSLCCPFVWTDVASEKQYKMFFSSGFVGVTQNRDNLELMPTLGWAVFDAPEEPKKKKSEEPSEFSMFD